MKEVVLKEVVYQCTIMQVGATFLKMTNPILTGVLNMRRQVSIHCSTLYLTPWCTRRLCMAYISFQGLRHNIQALLSHVVMRLLFVNPETSVRTSISVEEKVSKRWVKQSNRRDSIFGSIDEGVKCDIHHL